MTKAQKTTVFFSIGVILLLVFLIIFSEHGYIDYKKLKEKENQLISQIEALKQENRNLETEVQSLKTDLDYIRHIAKHEHDMVEKDELIFKKKTDHKKE